MFFFPLRDDNPTATKPYLVWALIALCGVVFLWQLGLAEDGRRAILAYGVTPATLIGGAQLPAEINQIPPIMTVFTSMFMHGGVMHFAGNMLYLWIFGDNIEEAVGSKFRFICFYLICGMAAAFAQALVDPQSEIPMIGASGAIAGMLGAYLVLFPRANVHCLVGFFIFFRMMAVPAFLVLLGWIGLQFLNLGQTGSGVAYVAHIGGFVAGVVLIPFFKKRQMRLFAPAHSRAFEVERVTSQSLHIPSMVQKRNTARTIAQDPEPTKPARPNQRHPWDDGP